MRWLRRNGRMKFVVDKTGETPKKNLSRLCFFPHKIHMELTKISSTYVWHRVWSRDKKWWSPFIQGLWRQGCRPTTPDTSSNEMKEMSVEKWLNEICGGGKREDQRGKPTQTPFRPPRNPHGVTEMRTRDPGGGKRASIRLCHGTVLLLINY